MGWLPSAGAQLSPGAQSCRMVAVKCLFANEDMTPERLPTAHCPAAGRSRMGVALAVGLQGQAGKSAGWSRLRQGKCHTEEEVQATGTVCSELSLQQGLGCSVFLTDSAVESRVCFWL